MKYGKIFTYENRNEAEIGKRYVFSDVYSEIYKVPEYKVRAELKEVNDNLYPFKNDCGASYQFIREVVDENNTLMTYRQLAEWLTKGNGQSKDEGSWVYQYLAYKLIVENKPVDETVRIRRWDSDEWVKPTVDIYERDCK